MSKEAMKQMVEALEDINSLLTTMTGATFTKLEVAVKAGRQAIAEAEKQEQGEPDLDAICQDLQEKTYTQAMRIAELEEALAKQEQGEPVGEMQLSAIYEGMVVPVVSVELPVGTKLYTTPQPSQPKQEQETIEQMLASLAGYRREMNDGQPCDAEKAGRALIDQLKEQEKTDSFVRQLDEAIGQLEASKQEQSAEHVGEPVGEMQLSAIYEGMVVPVVPVELPAGTKLYTTPQQRKPLTDEQIYAIQTSASFTWKGFARAIEAAHGITSATDFKE